MGVKIFIQKYRQNSKVFENLRRLTKFPRFEPLLHHYYYPRAEMEMGRLSWPMTHDPWLLHYFILLMGIGGGVAWWYWTTILVLKAN